MHQAANRPCAEQSDLAAARRWSSKITRESNALDVEEGVFTWGDPKRIAVSLKHSADASTRRKSSPFRSAMSMLTFYLNRAGGNLDKKQSAILEKAKAELRQLYANPSFVTGIYSLG